MRICRYSGGGRRRLLTFADVDGMSREAFDFWIVRRAEAMRLYAAGQLTDRTGQLEQQMADAGLSNRLLTYADVDGLAKDSFAFWVGGGCQCGPVSIFLDSGAFGAYTRGITIDLDSYCQYIEAHRGAIDCYAALDVIKDWRATAHNLDLMVARGLMPIPCFHRGSPWEELDRLARDFPYIALGGMVGGNGQGTHDSLTQDKAGPYLDECFSRLQRHWPVKVHLFGVVAQWVLERYPLFSADSASAIMGAGMGRVSRFEDGRLRSRPWQEDLADTWDGLIADGVGRSEGKSLSAHAGRRTRNIEAMLALERYITDLWAARGVRWD